MKFSPTLILAIPLIAAAPVPSAPPPAYTADQSEQVRCIAMLAIVANDQARGAPGWQGLPWLPARGSHFAGIAGKALMQETGRTRDQIKADMIAAVGSIQSAAIKKPLQTSDVQSCIDLMNRLDPPPPPPKFQRCAALVTLARIEARSREGNSVTVQKLSNVAAILDSKARDALRAEGKSGVESDVIMGLEREAIATEAKRNRATGSSFDIESCFALAAEK